MFHFFIAFRRVLTQNNYKLQQNLNNFNKTKQTNANKEAQSAASIRDQIKNRHFRRLGYERILQILI